MATKKGEAPAPISVVMPCYRCAHTVALAVRSVVEQTIRPLELIAVDDASDDETIPALEALRKTYGEGWVRLIRLERNSGAAAARNTGWNAARGEFVAFLDADDTWLPSKLERQYAFMRDHPQFLITGHRARYIRSGETPRRKAPCSLRFNEISRWDVLLKNPMVTPSILIRRDCALRYEANSRYMEDHRFLQEAVFSGLRVARLEEELVEIHKAAYGASGLSGQLRAMERGDLDNYRALRDAGRISRPLHAALKAYSVAKFVRRLLVVGWRRAIGI